MAAHPAGQRLRCPACHEVYVCVGTEVTAACDGRGRHKPTVMEPVVDAESREAR